MLSMKSLVQEFLFDCQVRNLSPRTIHNYEKQLNYFMRYLKEAQGVEALEDLKPIHIKQFVVMLQGKKHLLTSMKMMERLRTSLHHLSSFRKGKPKAESLTVYGHSDKILLPFFRRCFHGLIW